MVARLDEVVRKRLRGHRDASRRTLEPLRHPEVESAATDRVHLLVEDLTDLVVCEGEGIVAFRGDQLRGGRLVERVEERVFTAVACGDHELLEVEDLPQDGGGAEDLVALRAARGRGDCRSRPSCSAGSTAR